MAFEEAKFYPPTGSFLTGITFMHLNFNPMRITTAYFTPAFFLQSVDIQFSMCVSRPMFEHFTRLINSKNNAIAKFFKNKTIKEV